MPMLAITPSSQRYRRELLAHVLHNQALPGSSADGTTPSSPSSPRSPLERLQRTESLAAAIPGTRRQWSASRHALRLQSQMAHGAVQSEHSARGALIRDNFERSRRAFWEATSLTVDAAVAATQSGETDILMSDVKTMKDAVTSRTAGSNAAFVAEVSERQQQATRSDSVMSRELTEMQTRHEQELWKRDQEVQNLQMQVDDLRHKVAGNVVAKATPALEKRPTPTIPETLPIAKLTPEDREWICSVLSSDGADGSAKIAAARGQFFSAVATACDDGAVAGEQLMSKDPELVQTMTFADSGRAFFGVLAAAISEKRDLERTAASVATSAKDANTFTFGNKEEFSRFAISHRSSLSESLPLGHRLISTAAVISGVQGMIGDPKGLKNHHLLSIA